MEAAQSQSLEAGLERTQEVGGEAEGGASLQKSESVEEGEEEEPEPLK